MVKCDNVQCWLNLEWEFFASIHFFSLLIFKKLIYSNWSSPAVSFSYSNSESQEVSMNISRSGNKKEGRTFKCNSTAEITPNQMRLLRWKLVPDFILILFLFGQFLNLWTTLIMSRSSACKMVRTLVQLMRTLDRMPEEVKKKLVFLAIMQCSGDFICIGLTTNCLILFLFQRTILMKLLYYDDVTVHPFKLLSPNSVSSAVYYFLFVCKKITTIIWHCSQQSMSLHSSEPAQRKKLVIRGPKILWKWRLGM